MNKKINYYEILSVDFDFSDKELKSKYRTLSKKYHPDKNDGDDKHFKLLVESYKVLSNIEQRDKYDKESKYGKSYDPMLELLEFEFVNKSVSVNQVDDKLSEFKRKEMLHIILELSKFISKIKYERNVICSRCEGKGNSSISNLNLQGKLGNLFEGSEVKCDICEGTGMFNSSDCPGCSGDGYISFGLSKCEDCDGEGIKIINKKIEIKEKDFIDNKLMVQYHGNQSKYNGKTGNLYIIIKNESDII